MKKIFIILSVVLFFVSFIITSILGNKCTLKYNIGKMENVSVTYNSSIISCTEIRIDKTLVLELSSITKGKTEVLVSGDILKEDGTYRKREYSDLVYVHSNGVITIDSYFGRCRGDIAFSISTFLVLIMLLISLIRNYLWNVKKSMYRYENILLLGLIIFVVIMTVWHIFIWGMMLAFGYGTSVFDILYTIRSSGFEFSTIILPIAVIVSLFVSVSNVILLIKEGRNIQNMLGIFIGGAICLSTAALIAIYIVNSIHSFNVVVDFIINIFMTYITYLECVLLGTIILGIVSARHIPKFDKNYIIILGCMIRKDGTLTPLLKARVDRAIEFSKLQKNATGEDIIFVPSGGQGDDEIMSEGDAMKNYLLSQGIDEKNILVENKSVNTFENIKFSNKLITEIEGNHNIAFSTTNYHVFRAGVICNQQNIRAEGIGAKTSIYFSINAFIREFIATLVSQRKHHIRILIILIVLLLLLEGLLYFSIM